MKPLNGQVRKPHTTAKGFTLVELMIVVIIIAVLAVLSMFGFSKLRSSARGATCASNLRQIGAAMLAYAGDNNGQLPPLEDRTGPNDNLRGIWPRIVADGGYLPTVINSAGQSGCGAGVWACPDCTIVQQNYNGYGAAEGSVLKVKKLSTPNAPSSLRLSQIPEPERTWLVGDASNSADTKRGWYAVWSKPTSWTNSNRPAARHRDRVNVCMVDGHVESLTLEQLKAPDKNYTLYK